MGTHLGTQFEDALAYALIAHAGQRRKGTDIPYAAHLLAVSALVLEAGGTEAQAIAGLLHDAAEDCGGQPRLDDIRDRFDDEVADIVAACSDSFAEDPSQKAEWKVRKANYLAHLSEAPPEVLLVSLADKLHNATSILKDLRDVGLDVFLRFKASAQDSIAYYGRLVAVFDDRSSELAHGGRVMLTELRATVDSIKQISGIAPT